MRPPKVSVLIIAHNTDKFIGESVESILNQTFQDFELLILDDASTDRTWEAIQACKKKDKRIRIFRNKKNLYIALSRNKVVKMARGQYIAWQDADDISCPDRLARQCAFLETHPKVGIVGGYLEFFNRNGPTSIRKYETTDAAARRHIFRYSPVAEPVAMIRRECFAKVGYYNPKYPPAHDIDMSFRIGVSYKFANIPKVLLRYREHSSSATFKKLKKMELDTLAIRSKFFDHPSYHSTSFDRLYNILQLVSVYLIPSKAKIRLFNAFRNTKIGTK